MTNAPNKELMQRILSERRRNEPSHYHVIKDLGEKEIRDLSRVIENSIVTSMTKGRRRLH